MKILFPSLLLIIACGTAFASPRQKPAVGGAQAATTPRRPPQAKSQKEFNDYNTAYAITGGAASEKAADDFAARHPESELRSILYSKAAHEYQAENNPGKMLAMAQKVLSLDPDDTVALVLAATVLSDNLNDSDQDREQKVEQIRKDASRALQTVDSMVPPNATPEQIATYKNTLKSMAHSALGITNLKMKDDAGAEQELKTAAELGKAQPDAYVWYHLALAQDHQNKYQEALASVTEALRHTSANPDLARLAAGERDRLLKLTGGEAGPGNNSQPPR